jgi:hypothetical protein
MGIKGESMEVFSEEVQSKSVVPEYILGALERYIAYGLRPGSFLHCILANDALSAVRYADAESLACIGPLLRLISMHAPCDCFGSEDKVRHYLERKREEKDG